MSLFLSFPVKIIVSALIYRESFSMILIAIGFLVIIAESFDLNTSP